MTNRSTATDNANVASVKTDATVPANDLWTTPAGAPGDSNAAYVNIYFEPSVIALGVVGTLANALVLYALCSAKKLKQSLKNVNALFVNQMSADLFSCFMLIVTYAFNVSNIYLDGAAGYWICNLVMSENLLFLGLNVSVVNLAAITIERYLMIVHPLWHKARFKPLMIYITISAIWIGNLIGNMASFLPTSAVAGGVCWGGGAFASAQAELAFGLWNFLSYFVVEVLIFVYCYGHMLVVIRRQIHDKPSFGRNPSTAAAAEAATAAESNGTVVTVSQKHRQQPAVTRAELNAFVTMIFITILFVVCWLPLNVYTLMFFVTSDMNFMNNGYYATVFIAFLNICLNPFIYAAKYEVVRNYLLKLVHCSKVEPEAAVCTVATVNTNHIAL